MMVSTRGRYALRVMIDLAEHNNGKFIPLKDIAERQEISEKYLESIVKSLTKADVLEGLRGKGGGAGKGCSGIFVGYHHSGADQAMAARR